MPHPLGLITLLTDFGDRDSFVASMKGVILTINPHATIVDLSHHVPPHSVEDAAYLLKSCYRYFPEGTVHVAVVDPGVGSARRPLIAKSEQYFFLAPDNGLLTPILAEDSEMEVREIENADYRLTSPGHTFDGRDLFAPAAAWLTKAGAVCVLRAAHRRLQDLHDLEAEMGSHGLGGRDRPRGSIRQSYFQPDIRPRKGISRSHETTEPADPHCRPHDRRTGRELS